MGDATAETRNAADRKDLDSCHKPFGGCAQAADVMRLISRDIRLDAADVRTDEIIAVQHAAGNWSPFTDHRVWQFHVWPTGGRLR